MASGAPDFDFNEYTTPLIRIVDQQSMLAGAVRLFRFTRDHAATIAGRLKSLRETGDGAIGPTTEHAIAEDAIISARHSETSLGVCAETNRF